jgi:imidazolonepropionase-like amidohydrolase
MVVREGRFAAIDAGAADEAEEAGARVIEVPDGGVVIPGLFDLHAHYHLDILGEGRVDETTAYPALFLANGVTNTLPNGEASPNKMRALQERLKSGQQVGARLHRTGPYFGEARVGWDPDFTAEDIHRQVDALVAEGVAGFKAKTITAPHLAALIERAHHHGLTVTGHLGSGYRDSVNPRDAIHLGIDRIEHFMGGDAMTPDRSAYASLVEMTPDMPEFERVVQLYLDQGVNFDATLSAYGYSGGRDPEVFDYFVDELSFLTPYARQLVEERISSGPRRTSEQFERIYWVKQKLVKRFYDAGGGDLITLGTDHPSTGEYFSPFSVHRELHTFVKSGIPEAAALRFATINAARALGMADELGTIEEGKVADLVILAGDPLEDIRNTRHVRVVLMDGVPYDPGALLASMKGKIGPAGPEELDAFKAKAVEPPGGVGG